MNPARSASSAILDLPRQVVVIVALGGVVIGLLYLAAYLAPPVTEWIAGVLGGWRA